MSQPEQATGIQKISESYRGFVDSEGIGTVVAYVAGVIAFLLFVLWCARVVRRDARAQRRREERAIARIDAIFKPLVDADGGREMVRIPAHLPVTLTLGGLDAHHAPIVLEASTDDVSGGGLSLHTHHAPHVGARVGLSLQLGEHEVLHLEGTVIRSERGDTPDAPSLVGVRLTRAAPAAREHLAQWVVAQQTSEVVRAERRREGLCIMCGAPVAAAPSLHAPKENAPEASAPAVAPDPDHCARCAAELDVARRVARELARQR